MITRNKPRVLIHSIVFSPDSVSTAYLYNDIALKLKEAGFIVTVLTTTPHYNFIEDVVMKQPLKRHWSGLYYESSYNEIKVLHVPQKKYKSSVLRMLGFIFWHILSLILGLFQGRIDIILSPSPPLTIGFVNLIIGKIKNAKVIYNVQEIYPDFLINQGKLNFKPAVLILKWLEKFVYNKSDAVITIDQVFYDTILPRFSEPNKLKIIPNFVDTDLYRPLSRDEIQLDSSSFAVKPGVLKLMYAGNLGHAQSWEPLFELAQYYSEKNLEFWVIGEGVLKEYIRAKITELELTNIHLIPYQTREMMPSLISYADLHFIFMSPEMEGQGFPSKVYTIMACAKPLLVISGSATPIYQFLAPINCAYLVDDPSQSGQISSIIRILDTLTLDKSELKVKGANGISEIGAKYSSDIVTRSYVELVSRIISNK